MKRILSTAALGFSILATASAFAADGYVTGNVNLRAGPDSDYPSVIMLSAGTPVAINGCVDGWSWCDVSAQDNRGWIAGNFLQEEYQGQRVFISDYGVRIGVPIVSFVFGTYWGEHYRHRSWYGQRQRWSHMQPHYQAVTRRSDSSHGNSHDAQRGDARASSAPANRAAAAATSGAYQARPAARTVESQRTVTTNVHAPQTQANQAAQVQARHPAAPKPAREQHSVQTRTVTTHTATAPKPVRKAPPAKAAPEKKDKKDKGGGDKNQH